MRTPFEEDEGEETSSSGEGAASDDPMELLRAHLKFRLAHITEDHVLSVLNVRRARGALFGRQLFTDHAWDMILELYAARLANRRMTAAELARSIDLSESVVRRWISALVDAGVIASRGGPEESTEKTFGLTEEGAAKFAQLADHWISGFLNI